MAIVNSLNTNSLVDIDQKLLNKKMSVKKFLKLFRDTKYSEEEIIVEISKKIEMLSYNSTRNKNVLNKRKKPLLDKNSFYPEIALQFSDFYSKRNYAQSTLITHMNISVWQSRLVNE